MRRRVSRVNPRDGDFEAAVPRRVRNRGRVGPAAPLRHERVPPRGGGVSAGKRWRLDLLEFITVIDVASSQSSSIRLRTKRPVSRPKVDVAALEAAGEKLRPGKIGSAEHVRNIRKSKESPWSHSTLAVRS